MATVNYEYHSVLCAAGYEDTEQKMREWAFVGWEIFAVTNGHWGAQLSPAGVTLWMRRAKTAADESSATSAKLPSQRLAAARRAKKPSIAN